MSKSILPNGVLCLPNETLAIGDEFVQVIKDTLQEEGLHGENFSVEKKQENQLFTAFLVKIDDVSYDLKITFDCDDRLFDSEVYCLKENKFKTTPVYVCSGFLSLKTKTKFLLTNHEPSFSIRDIGSQFLFENLDLFFVSFFTLNNYKSKNKSHDYIDSFFLSHNIRDDFLMSSSCFLDEGFSHSEFLALLDVIENDLLMSGKITALEGNVFCHGMINDENLSFGHDFFVFKNTEYNFMGNPLIDLSFTCVFLSLSPEKCTILLNKYCNLLGLDFLSHKKVFDDCLYVASSLYFYSNLFSAYISKVITKNASTLSLSSYNINYSIEHIKKLKSFKQLKSNGRLQLLIDDIFGYE